MTELEKFESKPFGTSHLDKPVCPTCHFPITLGAPCTHCADKKADEEKQAEFQRAYDIKRLGGLKAFEDFWLRNYDNKFAIELCDGYPDKNLYIFGKAGVGKTHLATAIVRPYATGTVCKPMHIFRKLRGIKNGEEEQAAINRIAMMPHLVIDDIGVSKDTAFSISMLYEIIEMRDMSRIKGLILTSNLSLGELSEQLGDDRVTSRIAGMCGIIQIVGEDRRINEKEKSFRDPH